MTFEEALKCMREGKLVMRPTHLVPRTMRDGKIVEVYTKFNGKLAYEPLDTMNTCNIIAGDWEIVNEKAQDYVKKSHNVAKNVAQRNSQDLERVADTSKTLDHIVDATEKVSLTEQWKRGELEEGYYYTQYNPKIGKPFIEIELRNYLLDLAKVRDADTVKIITPVPNYEKWKSLNEILDSSLQTNKALAHRLNLCKDLLKECNHMILAYSINHDTFPKEKVKDIVTKIEGVLK